MAWIAQALLQDCFKDLKKRLHRIELHQVHELLNESQFDLHEEWVSLNALDEDVGDLKLVLFEDVIVLLPHFERQKELLLTYCDFERFNDLVTVVLNLAIRLISHPIMNDVKNQIEFLLLGQSVKALAQVRKLLKLYEYFDDERASEIQPAGEVDQVGH